MSTLVKTLQRPLPPVKTAYAVYLGIVMLILGMLIGPYIVPEREASSHIGMGVDHSDHLTHDHTGGHGRLNVPVGAAPEVRLTARRDDILGWNILLETANFRFAPEAVNGAHVPGQGHGHIYVNGEKIARLYGPAYHLSDLGPGEHVITVTLNANDHSIYAVDGEEISASVTVGGPLS